MPNFYPKHTVTLMESQLTRDELLGDNDSVGVVNYLIDVGISLAHHGFRKILFVYGHGSNHHLVEQAMRQIMLQYPDIGSAMLSWWEFDELREAVREIGEGGPTGVGTCG